jgi:hypothetical protein
VRAWVIYSVVRVGLFAGVFLLLWLLGIEWWLAAISAAVIALCISYIFFGKLRARVAEEIEARRKAAGVPVANSDEDAEDSL